MDVSQWAEAPAVAAAGSPAAAAALRLAPVLPALTDLSIWLSEAVRGYNSEVPCARSFFQVGCLLTLH